MDFIITLYYASIFYRATVDKQDRKGKASDEATAKKDRPRQLLCQKSKLHAHVEFY